METVTKRLYEGLFLVDSGEAAADWQGINDHVKKILERSEAEIVKMSKWDERPLAYPILGRKRGTYILVYFNAPSGKLTSIERDAQLSEMIMRILILRGDHLTPEDIEKDTPAVRAEKGVPVSAPVEKIAEEAIAEEAIAEDEDDEIADVDEKQD